MLANQFSGHAMSDNDLEILGQKFSYPSTWQGSVTVLGICFCISFLAVTLDDTTIESYAQLVHGVASHEAYEQSLQTIDELVAENEKMRSLVIKLGNASNLNATQIDEINEDLGEGITSITQSLSYLDEHQKQQSLNFSKLGGDIPIEPRQKIEGHLAFQRQQIQTQLGKLKQQQQQQLSTGDID